MKYLSVALIVMSVSAGPLFGLIMAAKYNNEADFGGWMPVAIFIVLAAAIAMFH